MTDLCKLEALVAARLDDFRMAHTRSVKGECDALATLYGLSDADRALLEMAALLHDCTKMEKGVGQVKLAAAYGIALTEEDLASPATLHAITGAAVAKSDFAAPDAVCAAIACHTTGREDMTLIDKLLFLADYIEPTRRFADCIRLRSFFYEECASLPLTERLDRSLVLAFDLTIAGLLSDGQPIHPQTVKSRNFLLKQS